MDSPESGPDPLSGLDKYERAFVLALLDGGSWDDAARAARRGKGMLPLCAMLGRPQVQAALETLVPLAPLDDARVVELLRPYLRAKLVAATTGKSPVTALRDLLSLGRQDASGDPMRAWMAAQERRARASTSTPAPAPAPGGMGEPPGPQGNSGLLS